MRGKAGLLMILLLGGLAQGERLRLAFSPLEPFKQYNAQGEAGGAYTEIVRALAKRLSLEVVVLDCPLKRCLWMLEHGEADMAIGLQSTLERERYLRFLTTPYRNRSADKVFYLRKAEAASIQQYGDLYGKVLGIKLGSQLFDQFDDDAKLNKQGVPDNETNFRKLLAGRVDVVPLAEDQGEYLLAKLNINGQVAKAPYRELDGSPRSIALAKHSPLVRLWPSIELAMTAMRRDGTLKRIYAEHYYQRYAIAPNAVSVD